MRIFLERRYTTQNSKTVSLPIYFACNPEKVFDVTLCGLVGRHQHFGEAHFPHDITTNFDIFTAVGSSKFNPD
jgi:hypothetical protein